MKESLLKTSKDFISFLHKKRLVLTICAIITLVFGLLNIFVFSNHSEALDSDAFITTWKVSGDSDGRTVKIPVYKNIYKHKINNAAYNYTIDWETVHQLKLNLVMYHLRILMLMMVSMILRLRVIFQE